MPDGHPLTHAKKILLVDDNPDVIRILKQTLEKKNYTVSVAMDGEEALKKTTLDPPDLVILDLGLPKLCGEEVCKAIRRNELLRHVRIIMLTGKSGEADRIIGRVIGADCYMTKPFKLEELVKTVSLF